MSGPRARRRDPAAPFPPDERSGFLLLDKSPGHTSFEALGLVKRALGTGRVGHTGTLDRFASGLLIALVGRATRLSPWISHCDKTYLGAVLFGTETDTLDPEGSVVARGPLPSRQRLEEALSRFRGQILQTPPVYSAIHVEGRRASERARSGETPELKARPVSIHELELVAWEPPLARLRVRCSGGTYIRSLARDLALAAGSRAHLVELRRLAVAAFSVEEALPPDCDPGSYAAALRPLDRTLFEGLGIPRLNAGEEALLPMIRGRPLGPLLAALEPEGAGDPGAGNRGAGEAVAVFAGERFAGIVERSGGAPWRYGFVYAQNSARISGQIPERLPGPGGSHADP
ncbi:MAG: tRNA pseudouridine(55) synthase TruB [Treponema sp.]|jgi:tRNA pseudouridine55 synthase|nr:tRNA pseudouridine(55) synthase TruB [Treponema sp.]